MYMIHKKLVKQSVDKWKKVVVEKDTHNFFECFEKWEKLVENTIKYDIISALCKKGEFFNGKRNYFY